MKQKQIILKIKNGTHVIVRNHYTEKKDFRENAYNFVMEHLKPGYIIEGNAGKQAYFWRDYKTLERTLKNYSDIYCNIEEVINDELKQFYLEARNYLEK